MSLFFLCSSKLYFRYPWYVHTRLKYNKNNNCVTEHNMFFFNRDYLTFNLLPGTFFTYCIRLIVIQHSELPTKILDQKIPPVQLLEYIKQLLFVAFISNTDICYCGLHLLRQWILNQSTLYCVQTWKYSKSKEAAKINTYTNRNPLPVHINKVKELNW